MKFLIIFFVSFISSSFAISVSCEYSVQEWSYLDEAAATCDGKVNQDNNTSITSVPESNKFNNLKVQMFKVTNDSLLTFIPQKISTFYPNFLAIYLGSCKISKLNSNDLSDYKNLQWLSLSHNQIEHIPKNFFASTPDIRAIYFYGNKIKSLAANLFNPLVNLSFANFMSNECINQHSNPNAIIEFVGNLSEQCEDLSDTVDKEQPVEEPSCGEGSVKDRICYLEIQIEVLSRKNDAINSKLDKIITKLNDMDAGIFGINAVQLLLNSVQSEILNQDENEDKEDNDELQIEIQVDDNDETGIFEEKLEKMVA